ncbi:hypothetical protein HCN44_002278 [Aphidius gifuensis]|uniref:Dolichyl-diphosphooligosaccharide--protein glycosyltransferase subunit 2 n=1 Tax=Aphidius gifuensis TaxID=684658 RepID=A0A835CUN6_APHGI|nr:hypothetical protein HCN44_002278 [Aphidius gifuensis]
MNKCVVFTLLVVLLDLTLAASNVGGAGGSATSTNLYLTDSHRDKLAKVIEPGLKLTDVESVYYAVVGLKQLGRTIPNSLDICNYLIKSCDKNEYKNAESINYIASTWKAIGSCSSSLPTSTLISTLNAVVDSSSSSIADYYHVASAHAALGRKIDTTVVAKLSKILEAASKKEESLLNLGYIFHIAAELGPAGKFALNKIEDTIIQADEVDGKLLQFEGGLSVTSLIVTGIEKLSMAFEKLPPVTSQQIVKLTNYLLSRLTVQQPKGVVYLLSALNMLAKNKVSKPVAITLAENGNVISAKQPYVTVKVCDVLGNPLVAVPNVVANSASRVSDDVVVISKQNFKPSTTDKTLFMLNFNDIKPQRDFYKVDVAAGAASNAVEVKVITDVKVDYLEIGTGDADQTTQPKLVKVSHPNKLSTKIEADSQQKIVMKFMLRDTMNDKPMRVHQAFVRFSTIDKVTNQLREVIFVAEPDSTNVYKFDMPIGSSAQTFNYESGQYAVNVIIGDALLSNSFEWYLGDVSLKFPDKSNEVTSTDKSATGGTYKQKANTYVPKPEIKHMFREPEKRPPVLVSNLFTGLCLAPVLILLVLWVKLDVNVSKFPFSISAIVFHLGLGSIFVLFGIFWLQLNMFVTLRYLFGLGVVTFLSGSKLLSHINQSQKLSR